MGVMRKKNEESGFERDQKSEVQLQVVATKECSKYLFSSCPSGLRLLVVFCIIIVGGMP